MCQSVRQTALITYERSPKNQSFVPLSEINYLARISNIIWRESRQRKQNFKQVSTHSFSANGTLEFLSTEL